MYFITTVQDNINTYSERTVGFYKTFKKAEEAIVSNVCDIFENGYYNYAIITKIYDGIYPRKEEIAYYKYTAKHKTIERIDRKDVTLAKDFSPYIIG